mgnify:CR=1 FL=1
MNRAATSAVSAPGRLADFQRAFVRALLDPGASSPGRGFAVHRNTVLGGCIDALEANYPVVAALVGRDWFRDAAAGHVRASPPTDSRLRTYGADFHAFLASLPIAEELPFLPGVALLERFWREAHAAADAGTLRHGDLTGLAPEALARLRLRPHPAARWGWFDAPVASIWLAHQADDEARCRPALEALAWRAEGALVTRPDGRVAVRHASRAACALLDACCGDVPLGAALAVALDTSPEGETRANAATGAGPLRELVEAGAFLGPDPGRD